MWGVLLFALGLLAAVISNQLKRSCSLIYEQHSFRPPHGRLFGFALPEPGKCFAGRVFWWLSASSFLAAVEFDRTVGHVHRIAGFEHGSHRGVNTARALSIGVSDISA